VEALVMSATATKAVCFRFAIFREKSGLDRRKKLAVVSERKKVSGLPVSCQQGIKSKMGVAGNYWFYPVSSVGYKRMRKFFQNRGGGCHGKSWGLGVEGFNQRRKTGR
jgi:hypothetical protein